MRIGTASCAPPHIAALNQRMFMAGPIGSSCSLDCPIHFSRATTIPSSQTPLRSGPLLAFYAPPPYTIVELQIMPTLVRVPDDSGTRNGGLCVPLGRPCLRRFPACSSLPLGKLIRTVTTMTITRITVHISIGIAITKTPSASSPSRSHQRGINTPPKGYRP